MSYLLLTGATGMLGHYLTRDALRDEIPLAAIVRSTATMPGHDRLEAQLQSWERRLGRYLPRPKVFNGDLLKPNLGLDSDQRRWIQENCSRVLHSAANVSFIADGTTNEPFRTNVEGTRELLNFCRELGISDFHHVSTSYVCGNRTGVIRESKYDCSHAGTNDYENSKIEAEQLIQDSDFLDRPTIYRPSIIVGDSQSGDAAAFHGVYTALRLAHLYVMAKRGNGRSDASEGTEKRVDPDQFLARLGLRGDERKNLIPVDWVSAAILKIVQRPECHGRIYHLTNPKTVLVDSLKKTMAKAVTESLRERPTRPTSTRSEVIDDVGFDDFMGVYRTYFCDDPVFDTTNTNDVLGDFPCPQLDEKSLLRLWMHAIKADFSNPVTLPKCPAIDFSSCFSSLRDSTKRSPADQVVRVEISGPGGGSWLVSFARNCHAESIRTGCADANVSAYLNSATATAIADGSLDIQTAIYRGRLILEGDIQSMALAVPRLTSLFERVSHSIETEYESQEMVISK